MRHDKLGLGDVHRLTNYEYATATERTAAADFTADDIGKIAKQTDNNTYWELTSVTPTWQQIGGGLDISITEIDVSDEDSDVVTVQLQVKVSGSDANEVYGFRMWLTTDTSTYALSATAADNGFSATDGVLLEEITSGKSFWYLSDEYGYIHFDVEHSGTLDCYLAVLLPDGSIFLSSQLSFS